MVYIPQLDHFLEVVEAAMFYYYVSEFLHKILRRYFLYVFLKWNRMVMELKCRTYLRAYGTVRYVRSSGSNNQIKPIKINTPVKGFCNSITQSTVQLLLPYIMNLELKLEYC